MNHPAKFLRLTFLTAALSALCIVSASAASIGVGTVQADGLRLREKASTNSNVLATASKGENVIVLEDAGNNWYKVDLDTVEGYMSGEFLNISKKADVEIGHGMVKTDGAALNVRSGPSTEHERVAVFKNGAVVSIVGIENGWYKIKWDDGVGYVSSEYMVTCKDSAGSRGKEAAAPASNGSLGQQVANYAKGFLGAPYVYGASGPRSFDCSGFTSYIYRHFGYTINRGASSQLKNGTPVSKANLQPGDLVFFRYNTSYPASHVGIYIGGGQFIHASTNGNQVRINSLLSGHYNNVYLTARRIF